VRGARVAFPVANHNDALSSPAALCSSPRLAIESLPTVSRVTSSSFSQSQRQVLDLEHLQSNARTFRV
jgi:hypothetical protein